MRHRAGHDHQEDAGRDEVVEGVDGRATVGGVRYLANGRNSSDSLLVSPSGAIIEVQFGAAWASDGSISDSQTNKHHNKQLKLMPLHTHALRSALVVWFINYSALLQQFTFIHTCAISC